MIEDDRLLESVKFLLTSVKKLSDRFIEADAKLSRSFDGVASDVADLLERIELLEHQLVDFSDSPITLARPVAVSQLPVRSDTAERAIPALNLSLSAIIDVYASTPILLEPFSRPCGVSGRTLSGEILEVELELVLHGTIWALEVMEVGWLLFPRPGTLERNTQLQSPERIFDLEGDQQLPVILQLIKPAQINSSVYGRRWLLKQKGVLSVTPDPLRVNPAEQIAKLEARLAKLEGDGPIE